MFGFGPPADRQARREWWRRQIQRQNDSKVPVAELCERLGVSAVTFYAWKRRFREAPIAAPLTARKRQAEPAISTNGARTATFLPVSILDSGSSGQLEIQLPNTCLVRLTGAVDPKLLRVAIRTAGQLGDAGQGAD